MSEHEHAWSHTSTQVVKPDRKQSFEPVVIASYACTICHARKVERL